MDSMLELARERNINVIVNNMLGHGVDGIYLEEGNNMTIGINKDIISNTSYARCVLAEELGHHFTTVGSCIPKMYFSYADRAIIDKAEYKAMKWACNYLIPENELLDALRDGLYELWELAEYFTVTDEFMQFRIKLFRGE